MNLLKPKDRLGMSLNRMMYCFLQMSKKGFQHPLQESHRPLRLVIEQIHLIGFEQIVKW